MKKKLVIFDFDGVLVTTAEIGYLLHAEKNPHLSREYFDSFSHGNFLENMNKAIREDGYSLQENWEELYREKLLNLSAHDVIDALVLDCAEKYHLAIVSSSDSSHIQAWLEKEKLIASFADVLGSDVHVSKVVKIKTLLEKYSLSPNDVVFITDTLGDIREGKECGVNSIAVTWGTHNTETLKKGEPYIIVDTVPELEATIDRFFSVQ
jgi:phosphoglycolate phosphatase